MKGTKNLALTPADQPRSAVVTKGARYSRRDFLGVAGAATAATIVPRHVLGGVGYVPPSEILNLAVLGTGGQGLVNIRVLIKNFLTLSLPQTQVGITMADGGDIPVGILSQFDEKTWSSFEEKFIV